MRRVFSPDAERRLLSALRDGTRPKLARRLASVINAVTRAPTAPGFRYRSFVSSRDGLRYNTVGFDAAGEPWFVTWRVDRDRDELQIREVAPGDPPV